MTEYLAKNWQNHSEPLTREEQREIWFIVSCYHFNTRWAATAPD